MEAGGDGLIKLWNYQKDVCIKTYDKHEGKIWALDVLENRFCSGNPLLL